MEKTEVTPIQRVPKMGAPKSAQKKVPENVRLKIYQEHGRALSEATLIQRVWFLFWFGWSDASDIPSSSSRPGYWGKICEGPFLY